MRNRYLLLVVILGIFISSCTVKYSQRAFDNILKVEGETLDLIRKSTSSYHNQKDQVTKVNKSFDDSIVLEKDRESSIRKNTETINMWDTVKKSLNKFFNKWEKKDKFSKEFVNNYVDREKDHFKQLKGLEIKKK